jgi:hypothetical protein
LSSPAITLLTAVCGLGVGILFVAGLLQRQWPGRYPWLAAASLVPVVVLAAGLPGKLKGNLDVLNAQRKTSAVVYEQRAHERCLQDLGRGDLVAALAFARERLPDDARYYARTPSIPCVALNLFPSELVPAGEFDPRRDWLVLDGLNPEGLPAPLASAAQATDRRITFSPSFALVAPEGVASEGGTQ